MVASRYTVPSFPEIGIPLRPEPLPVLPGDIASVPGDVALMTKVVANKGAVCFGKRWNVRRICCLKYRRQKARCCCRRRYGR